jgi:hypothetical protein
LFLAWRCVELPAEEPAAGPWRRVRIVDLVERLMGRAALPDHRPFIFGIDGRSSSGKTLLASRIYETVGRCSIVHTDDVAWHHSVFGWDDLITEGVLVPLREGKAVYYRPPAWERRGRSGAIEVGAGCRLVLVEGVGAGRRELSELVDALLWVQSDSLEVERRDAARVATGELEQSVQDQWLGEENLFLAAQRP